MLSDSDLTDISIEGDDNKSGSVDARKSTGSKPKRDGYRLRNVLKPGRTTQYTAKALYDQVNQGDIELNPDYQRDVVWSDIKQIGLIDSIFRNFYIPPIIFSVTTEDDGTERRVCIDGKQRITSIQKFISGLIPYRDPFTSEKLWFVDDPSNPKQKSLPPQYKTLFQNKQIVCIEYNDLPADLEREVFQRVQMGMALTTAEKLQAVSGPWPSFIREILQQYHDGEDGIASKMELDLSRGRDFQNIAQTLFRLDHLPEQRCLSAVQLERWMRQVDGPTDIMRAKIHEIFKIYKDLMNNKQLKAPFTKPIRVAPVEFIMIAVLIAVHRDKLSLSQLSQAIGILRTKTRAEHADLRTNERVFKTMFSIVFKDIKAFGRKDPTSGAPNGYSKKDDTSHTVKRKRKESSERSSSDEDHKDPEYSPTSRRKRSTPMQPTRVTESKVSETNSSPQVKHANVKNFSSALNGVRTPASSSALEKIRAARHRAEVLNKTETGGPPTSHSLPVAHISPTPYTHPVPSDSIPEVVMIPQSSSSHPEYIPSPSLTQPLDAAARSNSIGVTGSSSGSLLVPIDSKYNPHTPLIAPHSNYPNGVQMREPPYSPRGLNEDRHHRQDGR